ncbi:mechanosensitive ion channel family protein [Halosegnis longus]|uniref:Mechanosensitive ion channel family protein n=1 Tax=Halosegnis longus TaxID=2216012 RepID=A0AAJ4UW70_9EURY|nr:mechanosensitive ion channel family protein [Halosegnis longus]RNJ26766.1 mechanosensitive ion channel family protein [Salella cibi]
MQPGTPTATPEGLRPPTWLPTEIPGWLFQLATAVTIVVVGYYASKLARRLLGRRIARRFKRQSISQTVLRATQMSIFVVAIFTALAVFGIRISDLAISLSVFSAVIGIVLAPLIGSIISGFFILSEQPYEIGDMIQLADRDTYGFVEEITLRYTKLFTLDNTFLVLPNGAMRDRDVVNFSAEDSRTRLALDVLVTYESDIPAARDRIERAARQVDTVINGGPDIRIGGARYPASPTCYIETYGDHGVNLRLRYWVTEPYKLLATRSKVQTNIRELFADADVEMAYPHSHLVFDDTSGEVAVGMRERAPEEYERPGGDSSPDRTDESGPTDDGGPSDP